MEEGSSIKEHVSLFTKAVLDLKSVDVRIDEEDQAVMLLCSLPSSFENQELPDRKSTRLNSSHYSRSRMPSSA